MQLRVRHKKRRFPDEEKELVSTSRAKKSNRIPLQKKVSFSIEPELQKAQKEKELLKTNNQQPSEMPSMFILAGKTSRSSSTATSIRFPRSSPPADAFPLRSFTSSSYKNGSLYEYDTTSSSDSDSDSDSSNDIYSSSNESNNDEDDFDEGKQNDADQSRKFEMEKAARLLLSVSPAIQARPRSVSHLEPLESLAGLASLDDNQLNSTTGGSGSINKLHACLSGLSRGSQASYGSLASFNDGRSLYHAMAPQSFLLSNLTRQRERRKINKKLNKKKNKKNKKKRNRKKKSDDSEPEKKRRKKTIIALPKDCFTSNSTESIKSSKKTKKALKPKKPKKTKKLKVLDAAAQAAQASAELVNAPINPDCPEFLKSKFGKIYNNFGRVGIYTPSQRLIIMNRYRLKRTNRVWKKVVRYDCRKNLADTRLRIKGRFVRRDSEEAKIYFANLKKDLDKQVSSAALSKLSGKTNVGTSAVDDSAMGMKSKVNIINSSGSNSSSISSSSSSGTTTTTTFAASSVARPSNSTSEEGTVPFILPRGSGVDTGMAVTAVSATQRPLVQPPSIRPPSVDVFGSDGSDFTRRPRAVSSIY